MSTSGRGPVWVEGQRPSESHAKLVITKLLTINKAGRVTLLISQRKLRYQDFYIADLKYNV